MNASMKPNHTRDQLPKYLDCTVGSENIDIGLIRHDIIIN